MPRTGINVISGDYRVNISAKPARAATQSERQGGLSLRFGTIAMIVSAVVLAVGLAIAISSLWVSDSFKKSSAESATLMSSMRDHMTADMMHDSMRGVVFRAMYAALNNDAAMLADARTEIDEYGGNFRDQIVAQNELDLPADVRAAVDGLAEPLDAYILAAAHIVDRAKGGDVAGAQAELASFDASFKSLEGKMSDVSDSIEAANAEATDHAIGSSQMSDIVNWGGLALFLLLSGAIAVLSRSLVAKPLAETTSSLTRLAEGDLDVAPIKQSAVREVAEMGAALDVFRGVLQNRAELAKIAEAAAATNTSRVERTGALNADLSKVVGAAILGDFGKRVGSEFGDAELNGLAQSVNNLVETVDRGVSETGQVLSALAKADLTHRRTASSPALSPSSRMTPMRWATSSPKW